MLVPILFFLYPSEDPATITSITLTVVFCNAFSGSIAYHRLKRIDYRSGIIFAAAAIPGAVGGAYLTNYLDRSVFQYLFGSILLLVSIYLLFRPEAKKSTGHFSSEGHLQPNGPGRMLPPVAYNLPFAIVISLGVGLFSSLLGIGGGIIHVPAMTQVLHFPVHAATATSLFVITVTSIVAVFTHLVGGTYSSDIGRVIILAAGAVIGAQVGARLSQRVHGSLIVRLLALGLAFVAIRMLASSSPA